jgi:protein associated with RNAse G/E
MEAKELRIGNWVKEPIELGGKEAQILRIDTDKDGYSHYIDHCSPIPLTGQKLIQFGFDVHKGYYEKKGIKIHINEYINDGRTEFILVSQPSFVIKLIKNEVHILQNLCFALTGIELKINHETI